MKLFVFILALFAIAAAQLEDDTVPEVRAVINVAIGKGYNIPANTERVLAAQMERIYSRYTNNYDRALALSDAFEFESKNCEWNVVAYESETNGALYVSNKYHALATLIVDDSVDPQSTFIIFSSSVSRRRCEFK